MAKKFKRDPGRVVETNPTQKRWKDKLAAENKAPPKPVPDSWTGGPNRWSKEERNKWNAFLLDPKGGDADRLTGSRSRPISIGIATDSTEQMYQRMVARGVVAESKRSTAIARGRGHK